MVSGNIRLQLKWLTSGIVYQIILLTMILLLLLNLIWTNFGLINQLCLASLMFDMKEDLKRTGSQSFKCDIRVD